MIEKNGIIKDVYLGICDHGMLTANLYVDRGDGVQGFGGWNLEFSGRNVCAEFIKGCFLAAGTSDWGKLKGLAIRVRIDTNDRMVGIGHIIRDDWFMLESLK